MTAPPSLAARLLRSWWTRLLVSVAILAYLASTLDMTASLRAVLTVDRGPLALVLALVAIDRLVMIARWVLLLRATGAPIAAAGAARIFLISSFIGSFLPAGVGGDAARAYGLSRVTDAGPDALASVIVDRVLGILALLTMGVVGVIVWMPASDLDWRAAAAALFVAAVCVGVFWADRLLTPIAHLVPPLHRVALAISRYRDHRSALTHVMLWSVVVQVLRIVQAYVLGLGLGIQVPFRYYLLFMPVGLLMLLLPISVSGFGVPQGVIVWLLRPMGVADERAFALATLIVLTGLAGNLPGLLLWLRQRREIL